MDRTDETKLNEKKYVEKFVSFNKNLAQAQNYIKENFGIDSKYDEETGKLNIWTNNIYESLQLIAAKEYVNGCIDESMLLVEYGKV